MKQICLLRTWSLNAFTPRINYRWPEHLHSTSSLQAKTLEHKKRLFVDNWHFKIKNWVLVEMPNGSSFGLFVCRMSHIALRSVFASLLSLFAGALIQKDHCWELKSCPFSETVDYFAALLGTSNSTVRRRHAAIHWVLLKASVVPSTNHSIEKR